MKYKHYVIILNSATLLIIIFISSWVAKCCPGICHVRLFTYLSVANPKTRKSVTDMAKIATKSEKITTFGGIFPIMEQFSSLLSSTNLLNTWVEVQTLWLSIHRNHPLPPMRLFLRRFLR